MWRLLFLLKKTTNNRTLFFVEELYLNRLPSGRHRWRSMTARRQQSAPPAVVVTPPTESSTQPQNHNHQQQPQRSSSSTKQHHKIEFMNIKRRLSAGHFKAGDFLPYLSIFKSHSSKRREST